MTPPPAATPAALLRLKLWLAALLGKHYASVVATADRAVTAFLLAFGAKVVGGDVLSVGGLFSASLWQTAAFAGLVAGLSVLKSTIMVTVTGSPALFSPASRTLRARARAVTARPQHAVPVLKPGRPTPHDPGEPARPRPVERYLTP